MNDLPTVPSISVREAAGLLELATITTYRLIRNGFIARTGLRRSPRGRRIFTVSVADTLAYRDWMHSK